jgi:class 3 adenylate cyclase/streptogramin lyase
MVRAIGVQARDLVPTSCAHVLGSGTLLPMRRPSGERRFLATVLFTDIVGSTDLAVEVGDWRWRELLARHHAIVRRELKRFNGKEIDTAGDGFFARLESPASAIRCACAAADAVRELGVQIRAGIHVGECEQMGRKVGGIAVHTAARVLAAAQPGDVLVSGTTKELVGGAGIGFVDQGIHQLKGVPGEWRLFAVDTIDGARRLPPSDPADAQRRRAAILPAPFVRRRRGLLIAASVAILLAAAMGIFFLMSGERTIVPGPNTASRIDTSSHRFAQTIPVGDDPVGVAAGAGSIWVINAGDSTVTRIAPTATPAVLTTKSTQGSPTGIAVGEGSAWITTGFGTVSGKSELIAVDPASDDVQPATDLPSGTNAVATGDGFVWVADAVRNELLKINPKSHVVAPSPIAVGDQPVGIAILEEHAPSIWVANGLGRTVTRIDPSNGEARSLEIGSAPKAIAVGSGSVWVATEGNTVVRLDLSGNTITSVNVPAGPGSIAVGRDGIWVACSTAQVVVRLDDHTNRIVQELRVNGRPTALAADPSGDVWLTVTAI